MYLWKLFKSAKITWVHELQIRKLLKSMWSANRKSGSCKKYMVRKSEIRKLQHLRKVRKAGTTTQCRN